jgi:hypothetical protein
MMEGEDRIPWAIPSLNVRGSDGRTEKITGI